METEAVAAKRSKTHTRYYLSDGSLVPGTTTVLGVLAKPALVPWANRLGLQGIEVGKYVDALATIGTIGHAMILAHHKNEKFKPDGHAADLIDKAENCLISYFEWEKNHIIKPVLVEAELVSHEFGYGGTVDFYGEVDGVLSLVDYKTGKAIYAEYIYQLAAYERLLEENGHAVDGRRVLQIGRSEDEGFSEKVVTDTTREFQIFFHCLKLYGLRVGK